MTLNKMCLFALTAALLFFSSIKISFAEQETIIVNFNIEELAFAINILNSIEITKEEKAPFVDLKNLLIGIYKLTSSQKQETVDIIFLVPQAKNLLILYQRAKLHGNDSFLLQGIVVKITDALKIITYSKI